MGNTEKFTGKANVYDKYRPGYPQDVYGFIAQQANLKADSIIADVGAGTGKFAVPFLTKGYQVICVEPNTDMKSIMDEKLGEYKNYAGVAATAENTTLANRSVDCITVAQAFHWFDRTAFKLECQRILKENGKVFLIWNKRDEEANVTQELYQLNKRLCSNFKGFTGGISKVDTAQFEDFYKKGSCNVKLFENNVCYDTLSAFIGRSLSSSYAPKEDDGIYGEYVEKLTEIYKKYSSAEGLNVRHSTMVYWGEL